MPTTKLLELGKLTLDLTNYRTVTQKNEINAIHALIAVNPTWFWALMESLIEDGYHLSENIIILISDKKYCVKEGNRRIGALKIIHGMVDYKKFDVPINILEKMQSLDKTWFSVNFKVPCAVYSPNEIELVDRQVSLIHGKGEKAGRDKWNAVARARHSRDKSGKKEYGLDLLEKYLKHGKNLSALQKERWGGDYPLTVLDEVIQKVYQRFKVSSSKALIEVYPSKVTKRNKLEEILSDVGLESIRFPDIRDQTKDIFSMQYGLEKPEAENAKPTENEKSPTQKEKDTPADKNQSSKKKAKPSYSINDPRSVIKSLKSLKPRGNQREKLLTLISEAKNMKLDKHAHAFCFLLRVIFELSAKAYCNDHRNSGPKYNNPDGSSKKLETILKEIVKHLTNNNKDKESVKNLHGAMTELSKSSGLLSVTSMNQLVHNPKFVVDEVHICTVFHNIFPLLEEMNNK